MERRMARDFDLAGYAGEGEIRAQAAAHVCPRLGRPGQSIQPECEMKGGMGRHRFRTYGRKLNALANPDEPCVNTTGRLEYVEVLAFAVGAQPSVRRADLCAAILRPGRALRRAEGSPRALMD
jgi:hypothetical protein